jgi:hypothetical protein
MLLNLHCHSNYSDGANSILELASAYQKAGHIALCVTDHDYTIKTSDVWEKQCAEAARVSAELNFPIIVGLEVYIHAAEEVLVFGKDACLSILNRDKAVNITFFKEWYKQQQKPFALILAHPYLWLNDDEFYQMLDGYEVANGGCFWDESYVQKMEARMPSPRRAYKNHDTHCLIDLATACNEVAEDLVITDETDLISYLSVVKEWRI